MKILHLCLSCFYYDGYNYQENVLPRINHDDGHDVRILASTEVLQNNIEVTYVEPGEYITEYGVPIKRLPYVNFGLKQVTVKLRKYKGLYEEIVAFSPDVIMCHDISFWSVKDVIRYKKKHPGVKFYTDTHTAAYNSGTNWISLHLLHRTFYKRLIQSAIPYLDSYFYIGDAEKSFSVTNYGVPEDKMEFYPLGGTVFSDEDYQTYREAKRQELGLSDQSILFCHSGKMTAGKRTEELLKAFSAVQNNNAALLIIGTIAEEMQATLLSLIEADRRIIYLGWKSSAELLQYLCASDVYCQPGSVSATMQNAMCCRCAILSYPHECYVNDYSKSGISWVKDTDDMATAFRSIALGHTNTESMKAASHDFACNHLDYKKLAARLYQ